MGSFEWPCYHCGQGQKTQDQERVGGLCAACDEKFHKEVDESQKGSASKAEKKKRLSEICEAYYGPHRGPEKFKGLSGEERG